MSKLLHVDRLKRIPSQEFMRHPWIRNEGCSTDDDPRKDNNDINSNVFCEIQKEFLKFINYCNVKKRINVFFRSHFEYMKPRDFVRLKSIFIELDKNCDKKLSFEQFKTGLIKTKHSQWTQKAIEQHFENINIDDNENSNPIEISFYDLLYAVVHDYQVYCDERLYQACQEINKDDFDVNVIKTDDLKNILKIDPWTKDRYDEILKIIDESGLDEDGKINVCNVHICIFWCVRWWNFFLILEIVLLRTV